LTKCEHFDEEGEAAMIEQGRGHGEPAVTPMDAPDPQRAGMFLRGHSAGGGSVAWRLPGDRTCASAARDHVRQTLTPTGMPEELIHSAATVASELAANAFVHALGARPIYVAAPGLPELWMHLIQHPEARLVVSVFDANPRHEPVLRKPTDMQESGRGMRIVAALSSRWGWQLSRSRVGPEHVPGKAVWAALPLPPPHAMPVSCTLSPTDAAEFVGAALAGRGIHRVHRSGDCRLQVLSVRAGLTVWVGETIYWQGDGGGHIHHPLCDLFDAVESIIARHEVLALRPDGIRAAEGGFDVK
jgi:anti-sigma regulatory factor (Ser/Thr protein kinase)